MSTTFLSRRERLALERSSTADAVLERRFRPDIEGLRGVAVLLVVLYHAGLPGLPGGYVGVDVFFVISGFLITSHLTDRYKGPPPLKQFYAKRIRRLLPSALLVLLVTLVADRLFGPVLTTTSVAQDGLAAATLSINYHFAQAGLDYLQVDASPSPLLHYWSLAVEEQFYLVWPLLMVAIIALTRRLGHRARTFALLAAILLVVGVSLAASIQLTDSNAPLGYFSLQSRAWEFGVGALVAVAAPLLARTPSLAAAPLSWMGLGLIVAGAVVLNDGSRFPGYLAIIPVGGTALLIAAGLQARSNGVERLLGRRGIRFLGSVSYTWYLWHWPVLVLAPSIFGTSFGLSEKLAMVVISLWLAVLTSLVLERPLLRTVLVKIPWFRFGAVGVGVLALVAGLVIALPPAVPGAGVGVVSAQAGTRATGGPVTPTVVEAAKDTFRFPASCIAETTVITTPSCTIESSGKDRGAAVAGRVVLLGDSHAAHWYPVVRSIADKQSKDVEILTKVGCPLADLSVVNPQLKRTYTECTTWRERTLDRLTSGAKPSVIFVSSLNYYRSDGADKVVTKAWSRTMDRITSLGVPVVYLADTPHPDTDVPTCVAAHIEQWSACAFPKKTGLVGDPLEAAIAEGSFPNTVVIDANTRLCPSRGSTCPAVVDGVLLYRDNSHLTNTAAASLTPVVLAELRKLEPSLNF